MSKDGNMIRHVLRHEEKLLHIEIEGKINNKRDLGRPRTSKIWYPMQD